MISLSRTTLTRSAAAAGAGLVIVALSACSGLSGGVSTGSNAADKADGSEFFSGDGNVSASKFTTDEFDTVAKAKATLTRGQLPAAMPKTASDIRVAWNDDKIFASWKGAQADIDSCVASTATVPVAPEDVRRAGSATDMKACGSVNQATVGQYTYYYGALKK